MSIQDAVKLIKAGGVPDYLFSIGGLGAGECIGIAQDKDEWITYFSERGAKSDIHQFANESDASQDFLSRMQQLAKEYGYPI